MYRMTNQGWRWAAYPVDIGRSAGVFLGDEVGVGDTDAGLGEEVGDGGLLLVEAEGLHGVGEVFYGEGLVVSVDDGDADGRRPGDRGGWHGGRGSASRGRGVERRRVLRRRSR